MNRVIQIYSLEKPLNREQGMRTLYTFSLFYCTIIFLFFGGIGTSTKHSERTDKEKD